jgi:hypothetical protein
MNNFRFNDAILQDIVRNKPARINLHYFLKIVFDLKEQENPINLRLNSISGVEVNTDALKSVPMRVPLRR